MKTGIYKEFKKKIPECKMMRKTFDGSDYLSTVENPTKMKPNLVDPVEMRLPFVFLSLEMLVVEISCRNRRLFSFFFFFFVFKFDAC